MTNRKIRDELLTPDFKHKKVISQAELRDFTFFFFFFSLNRKLSEAEAEQVMKRFGKSTRKVDKQRGKLAQLKRMLAHVYQQQIELTKQIEDLTEGEIERETEIPFDFYEPTWQYELEKD